MTAKRSDTFCILPWLHMYVNPDGSVLPCCVGEWDKPLGNVRQHTIKEIWNDKPYKQMRKNMLEGKRCVECQACYNIEDGGAESSRIHANSNPYFGDTTGLIAHTEDDGTLPVMHLKHFDVRWSNICNFKCRSCSSTYSSTWAQEDNAQGEKKPIFILADGNDNDKLYNQFLPHFKDIETFYFAGGEPLLTDKHYDILEHLISIGKTNVKLEYNSNCSVLKYKSKSVLELWKHFDTIHIGASLDHYGSRAEYIRSGTDWNLIKSNIQKIKQECPHIKMQSNTVVSVFNLYTLTDFFDYVLNEGFFDIEDYFPQMYNIQYPEYYTASVLDDAFKTEIIEKIQSKKYNKHIDDMLKGVVSYINNSKFNKKTRQQFKNRTNHYDIIRNENFEETFPELKGLI